MGMSSSLADCEDLSGEELSAVNGDVGGRSLVFIFDMGGEVLDGLCEALLERRGCHYALKPESRDF